MLPSLGIFLLLAIIIVVIKNIFSQKINGVQVLVLLGLVLITTISGYFIADAAKTYDTQIISGKVISKNRETVLRNVTPAMNIMKIMIGMFKLL